MKTATFIRLFLIICIVGFIGFKGYKYYDETYRGITAYSKVPETTPALTDSVADGGLKIPDEKMYEYTLKFVTADGEKINLPYTISGANPTPLQPGSFVKAEISKKRIVNGPNDVREAEIPKNILSKLSK